MYSIPTHSQLLEDAGFRIIRAVAIPSGDPSLYVFRFSVEARGGIKASVQITVQDDEVKSIEGLPPMYTFTDGKIVLTDTVPAPVKKKAMALQRISSQVSASALDQKFKEAAEVVKKAFDLGTAKLYMGKEKPRRYIGASHIGNDCIAYNSLCARGFPNDIETPRQTRIFQNGHALEDFVVAQLKAGGLNISEVAEDGKQHEYTALGGHVVCHLDGIITGEKGFKAVLEVKSMNKKRFENFVLQGVALSDPHYYAQVQLCMYLSGMQYAVFVCYCKDNSDFSAEIVPYNKDVAMGLMQRAQLALEARTLKPKKDFYCQFCFKRSACQEGKTNSINTCAQCLHASAITTGEGKRWLCDVHSTEKQGDSLACPNFIAFNNGFI